jgi:hypothetical protein
MYQPRRNLVDTELTEEELVALLAKEPGIGGPDGAKKALAYIRDAQGAYTGPELLLRDEEGEQRREDLLAEVRRLVEYGLTPGASARRRAPRAKRPDPALQLVSEGERKRGEATAIVLAELASGEPRVQRFRQDVLKDRLLSREEAMAFLHSPALAVFKPDHLEGFGVPIVGHVARLESWGPAQVEDDQGRISDGARVEVYIDPPGKTFKKEKIWDETVKDSRDWAIEWIVPSPKGGTEPQGIWQPSTLDDVRRISSELAKRYMWRPADAAMFVVTGNPPPMPPIRSGFRAHDYAGAERAIITLEIEPWTSVETVTRVYLARQQELSPRRRRGLGRPLDVYLFVTAQMRKGTRPTWRELVESWDSARSAGKPYGGNPRNLRRDYGRVRDALLFPYKWNPVSAPWKW